MSLPLLAQLGPISGELRYDYRYQDYEVGGNLTKYINRSPILNLRTRGNIVSPRLLSYSIMTSLNANNASTSSPFFSYSGSQYSWNIYNVTMHVLPSSPVRLRLAARDNIFSYKARSELETTRSGERQQEQRAEVSVQQVPWLPALSFSYIRSRTFATALNLYDYVNQTLSFSANGASDTLGSYNLNAVMTDFRPTGADRGDQYINLQFSAMRPIAKDHEVSVNSEFNKYSGYSNLSGGVGYVGKLTSRLRLSSGIEGNSYIAASNQTRALTVAQNASYLINSYFQSGVGVNGYLAIAKRGLRTDKYENIRTTGYLSHHREIGGYSFSNSLNLGYSVQPLGENFHNTSFGLSNSVTKMFGGISTSADYTFAYSAVHTRYNYHVISNSAGLSASGMLSQKIQSRTGVRFREDAYKGTEVIYRNNGSLQISQQFMSSFFVVIPFRLGLNGNANYYIAGILGRTYGWNTTLSSPRFFITGLSADYVYSSNYDQYYRRSIIEQSGSLSINWRAFTAGARLRYTTFPVRVREMQLTIARPF